MVSRTPTGGGGAAYVPPVRPAKKPQFWLLEFYGSAIGKKAVMAVTGIMLLGFVVAHMAGNLKIFTGENAAGVPHLDEYGEYLRRMLEPIFPHTGALWLLRAGLIAAFALHIHAMTSLTIMNRQSRPLGYEGGRRYLGADYAARTMRISGILLGLFIIFHLFDLTWGPANPDFIRGEPYHNLTESLERWWIAAIYIVANLLLGLHIFHGAWSMFQSLGWNNPRFNAWRRYFAIALAVIVVGGNISIVTAVLVDAV